VINLGGPAAEQGRRDRSSLTDRDRRQVDAVGDVTDGKDRWRAGTHIFVDHDVAALGDRNARLLEAELGEHVLFVRNLDKPGFIGALGNALGAASINIATFHLGRTAAGQDAICLIEVDQPLTPALLDAVRGLPNVIQVKSMKF